MTLSAGRLLGRLAGGGRASLARLSGSMTLSVSVRGVSTANRALDGVFADLNFKTHEELHKYSVEKPEEFWGRIGKHQLTWSQDFNSVMNCDMSKGTFEWFKDGKLNASVNCVDRHMQENPDKVALIWEQDEPGKHVNVTYKELHEMVCRMGNVLRRHDVGKGDIVAIYMPVSPLAVAAMLACGRVGALHNVVFAGFSAEALASRIQDASAVAVFTANEAVRGGKRIPLKDTVDQALKQCPTVKNVFVYNRTDKQVQLQDNQHDLDELMRSESPECPPEIMSSEDYLFLLYTSGSTGKPKGLAHSTAGYLTYASLTQKLSFDYRPGDVFGCVADIGWITGHSYVVYGPLVNGGTTVLFESTPVYPDPGRYWETVQRLGINQFYGAPTAIRLLLRYEDEFVTKYDRSSLRSLGSVGEPINVEAWHWYNDLVGGGKCDVVDTWWQTETGGICLTPRPSEEQAKIVAGKPMRPMLGIQPVLVDEKGQRITGESDVSGALCIEKPWPGIARTVYGDHKRFIDTYMSVFPGFYFSGDGGHRDADGHWQITGRMDDVINVTGHRLGTAEVEDAMDEHPIVAEAAVVGFPHEVKGEGVYAYVILKKADEASGVDQVALAKDLRTMVKKTIAGYAVPDHIQFCSGLPKTRSGKIMRRILRKVAADKSDFGDISTLADPSVVQEIVERHKDTK